MPLIKPFKYRTLKLEGHIMGGPILTLVDSGATNNFINEAFVLNTNLETIETQEFGVTNARGYQTICKRMIRDLKLTIGNYTIIGDFYIYPMGRSPHIVLGVQWLYKLGDVTFNYRKLEMSFFEQGERVTLRGIHPTHPLTTLNSLENIYEDLPRESIPISHGTFPSKNNKDKISLKEDKGKSIANELSLAFGNTYTRHLPCDEDNISNRTYDTIPWQPSLEKISPHIFTSWESTTPDLHSSDLSSDRVYGQLFGIK